MQFSNLPTVLTILIAAFVAALIATKFLSVTPILDVSEILGRVGEDGIEHTTTTTRTTRRTTITTTTTAIAAPTTPTTSTTTTITTTTTTTTTPPPPPVPPEQKFTAESFRCSPRQNGYNCSLSYAHNLNESAIIVFIISDTTGNTISSIAYTAGQGSGRAKVNYFCTNSGSYYMSWEAYRESDESLENPIAFSIPTERQMMSC